MKNEKIIEKLQKASDEYIDFLNEPYGYKKYEYMKVDVGDIFSFYDEDEDSGYWYTYMRLLSYKNKLYFIECEEDGTINREVNFDEYQELNKETVKEFEEFIKGVIPVKYN